MWLFFTQDLLQLVNEKKKVDFLIDLGWVPEGSFCLQVIKNGNWDKPLEEFRSKEQK